MDTIFPGASQQKVMHCLDLRHARRRNAPLRELLEPLDSDTRTFGQLALPKVGGINQFVCTLKQIHCRILAKRYPACKQNITQTNCDNPLACPTDEKNIWPLASPLSGR